MLVIFKERSIEIDCYIDNPEAGDAPLSPQCFLTLIGPDQPRRLNGMNICSDEDGIPYYRAQIQGKFVKKCSAGIYNILFVIDGKKLCVSNAFALDGSPKKDNTGLLHGKPIRVIIRLHYTSENRTWKSDITMGSALEGITLNGEVYIPEFGMVTLPDYPSELSEFREDSEHRVITDLERERWTKVVDDVNKLIPRLDTAEQTANNNTDAIASLETVLTQNVSEINTSISRTGQRITDNKQIADDQNAALNTQISSINDTISSIENDIRELQEREGSEFAPVVYTNKGDRSHPIYFDAEGNALAIDSLEVEGGVSALGITDLGLIPTGDGDSINSIKFGNEPYSEDRIYSAVDGVINLPAYKWKNLSELPTFEDLITDIEGFEEALASTQTSNLVTKTELSEALSGLAKLDEENTFLENNRFSKNVSVDGGLSAIGISDLSLGSQSAGGSASAIKFGNIAYTPGGIYNSDNEGVIILPEFTWDNIQGDIPNFPQFDSFLTAEDLYGLVSESQLQQALSDVAKLSQENIFEVRNTFNADVSIKGGVSAIGISDLSFGSVGGSGNGSANAIKFGNVSYVSEGVYNSDTDGLIVLPYFNWSNIQDVPLVFPPDEHTHSEYLSQQEAENILVSRTEFSQFAARVPKLDEENVFLENNRFSKNVSVDGGVSAIGIADLSMGSASAGGSASAIRFGDIDFVPNATYSSDSEGIIVIPNYNWGNLQSYPTYAELIAGIPTLKTVLDNKSDIDHTHNISDINNLGIKIDLIDTNKANIEALQSYFDEEHHALKANSLDVNQTGSTKLPVFFTSEGLPSVINELEVDGNIASKHGGLSAIGISDLSMGADSGASGASTIRFDNGKSYNVDDYHQSDSEGLIILPGLIWSNITGLQGKLDEKANVSHAHNQSDIEGLNNALSAKVDKDGNKVLSDNNFSNEDKAQITTNKGNVEALQGYFDAQGHAKKANSLDTPQVGSNKLPVYFTNSGVPEVINSLEVHGDIASTHGGVSAIGISDLSVSQDGSSSNFDVSIIAEPFSSAQNYKKGDLCTFADRLWRFKTSYSGAWDQSKVELSNVGEEVMGLKEVNDAQDDILSELAHALNYMELWY